MVRKEVIKELLAGLVGLIGLILWLWFFWEVGLLKLSATPKPEKVAAVEECWQIYTVPPAWEENGPVEFRVRACK